MRSHGSSEEARTVREGLRDRQREAIWKWRWLGFRDSTPAFKGSLVIMAAVAVWVAYVFVHG